MRRGCRSSCLLCLAIVLQRPRESDQEIGGRIWREEAGPEATRVHGIQRHPGGLSVREEEVVVKRSESELSVSEEEEPRRRPAVMEGGHSAGGTLPRQPSKSKFALFCSIRS